MSFFSFSPRCVSYRSINKFTDEIGLFSSCSKSVLTLEVYGSFVRRMVKMSLFDFIIYGQFIFARFY